MKKAIAIYLVLFLFTGVIYPLLITGIGHLVFPDKITGSFVKNSKGNVGSSLIAQKFIQDRYFWPRPSSINYNPLPSGGSNLSSTSLALKEQVKERKKQFSNSPPAELLYASGSGLDPHISPTAAFFQSERVAKARGIEKEKVDALINEKIILRRFRFIGEQTVNVLDLNLALDEKGS